MYTAYQAHADAMWPLRTWARHTAGWLRQPAPTWPLVGLNWPLSTPSTADDAPRSWLDMTHGLAHGIVSSPTRQAAAVCELLSLAQVRHHRPDYALEAIPSPHGLLTIHEEVVSKRPFCQLLHFRAVDAAGNSPERPCLLIVAPMSGHFATLLRETVRVALADHDVYITDWQNARDVSLWEGRFGLDEYIEDLMLFLRHLGPDTHLLSICQPCVAALAATALMAEDQDPATPASLTLMAGPVDCRVNPTEVNKLATSKSISWFEHNVVTTVPMRFAGRMRRVYPGFMQLTAFLSMNPKRHSDSLKEFYSHVAKGNDDQAAVTRDFYEEYFAVADLPAEFYLETMQRVFQDYDLARGSFTWRGRPVRPSAICHTRLLTVEGERDDICGLGQTEAAQALCSGLPAALKRHHVQDGAGHYGVFSGRRWEQQIYPLVRATVQQGSAIATASDPAPDPARPAKVPRKRALKNPAAPLLS